VEYLVLERPILDITTVNLSVQKGDKEVFTVLAVTLILLLSIILGALGFAVHVLWWIALAVLLAGLVGAGAWTWVRRHLPLVLVQVEYSNKESRDVPQAGHRRRWYGRW
jgi:lysylphosphatidylglycerol synthetase-like protein (DUF2156 family)